MISRYQKKKLEERYSKIALKDNLPVSFTDFKEKHYNMIKTLKNNSQQMMLMKMVRAAIKDSDYKNINQLFTYLMVNKEEEDLRRFVRDKVEAYSKIFKPRQKASSLKESQDPLRVLFEYVKKPYDDLESLTNKYILLVPELYNKLKSIKDRKEFLHQKIRHLIKKDDALFMSNYSKDMVKHLNIEDLEGLDFDFNNEEAKEAVEKIMNNYEELMNPISSLEQHMKFSEKELTTARQVKILRPDLEYKDILLKVQRTKGISFEDKPEHILAEFSNIKNKKVSEELHEKYQNDALGGGIRKRHIDKLLNKLKPLTTDTSKEGSQKNIFSDSLENYYRVKENTLKETQFINHCTGEAIRVDNVRMKNDPQYFTETVAKLAKAELENIKFKTEVKDVKEDNLIMAMMRSREFRKYYYFVRKFYGEKQRIAAQEGVRRDDNDNLMFYDEVILDPENKSLGVSIYDKKYQPENGETHNVYKKRVYNQFLKDIVKGLEKYMEGNDEETVKMQEKYRSALSKHAIKMDKEGVLTDIEGINLNGINFETNDGDESKTGQGSDSLSFGEDDELYDDELYDDEDGDEEENDNGLVEEGDEFIQNIKSPKGLLLYNDEPMTPEQFNEIDFTEDVFTMPRFDISDFRCYFPEEEYEEIGKQFVTYTRGGDQKSKENFIRKKLLGHKIKNDADNEIGKTLKAVFRLKYLEESRDVKASEILGDITPYVYTPLNSYYQKEKYFRNLFESMHKNELKREWLEYKQHKISQYLEKKNLINEYDLSVPFDFDLVDEKNVEESIKKIAALDHASNLIDMTENNDKIDLEVSRDHLAFEYFDAYASSHEGNTREYEERLYKSIYGDDEYEKYENTPEESYNEKEVAEFHKDLYELHPDDTEVFKTDTYYDISKSSGKNGSNRNSTLSRQEKQLSEKIQYLGSDDTEHKSGYEIHLSDIVDDTIKEEKKSEFVRKFEENILEEKFYDEEFDITLETDVGEYVDYDPLYDSDKEGEYVGDEKNYDNHEALSYTPQSLNESFEGKAYYLTLGELYEKLDESIKEQKENSLEIALEMFDRIKDIKLNHTETLNSKIINYDAIELADPEFKNKLTQELKKLKYSLDDTTSPSFSHIKELHRQGLAGNSALTTSLPNIEAEQLERVVSQLDDIVQELENKENAMIQLEGLYSKTKDFQTSDYTLKKDDKTADLLEKEIFEAYLDYQRNLLKELDEGTQDASAEHKIKTIRNIFGVMEPGKMENSGSDLIEFGMSHNIPDAVRLGENLAGLNNEDVPDYLLNRLNQYKLKNADQLRERIQTTAPMKSIIQRRKDSLMTEADRSGYFPSNYNELKLKYNDKYNRWRLPSIYKVDHQKYGLLGRLYGEERLEKFFR